MITITPKAAEQIRKSAKDGRMEGLPLRVAAQRTEDGKLEYAVGFDDNERPDDERFESEGIDVIVAATSSDLVRDMTIDFVELEPGKMEFIFLNPNDPDYEPPKEP